MDLPRAFSRAGVKGDELCLALIASLRGAEDSKRSPLRDLLGRLQALAAVLCPVRRVAGVQQVVNLPLAERAVATAHKGFGSGRVGF